MSDGTPLDALENGDIENAADAEKMQAILSDINASGVDIGRGQQAMPQTMQSMQPMVQTMQPIHQPMQPMQPMPPMMMQAPPQYQQTPPQYQHHYVPVDEPEYKPKKKTNIWASILERIRDPIFVMLIVFLVSLPVLHTFGAKHAAWAFAVGGQLSWFGLTAVSVLAGILFGLYRATSDVLGL